MHSSIPSNTAAEDRGMRKWFLWALLFSLLFHAVLFGVFRLKKLEHFEINTTTERLVQRQAFRSGRAQFDPKIFETQDESKVPTKQERIAHPKVPAPPQDKPLANLPDNAVLTPKATDLTKQIVTQKPDVNATSNLAQSQENATIQHELDSVAKQLVSKQPLNPRSSSQVKFSDAQDGPAGVGKGNATGFSNLDELLAHSGPLTGSVAPVNMPGGALFEYDKADLRPDAVETLRKLGELIEHNPRSSFSIEGHSDSFGTPDYNLKLSLARAEAVKKWLVDNMHVDPSRIQTQGFGDTRLIAPATGTREEQQINRRVEIVIRTPKK